METLINFIVISILIYLPIWLIISIKHRSLMQKQFDRINEKINKVESEIPIIDTNISVIKHLYIEDLKDRINSLEDIKKTDDHDDVIVKEKPGLVKIVPAKKSSSKTKPPKKTR